VPGKYAIRKILGFLCVLLSIGLFYAGLRPFGTVANEVTWLNGENGLRFGDYATIISSGRLQLASKNGDSPWSLELLLTPGLTQDTNTLVTFYAPGQPWVFSVHQYNSDVGIVMEPASPFSRERNRNMLVDGVFQQDHSVFLTITSGIHGTNVYANGLLLKTANSLFPGTTLAGQMVFGTSATQNDSWSGTLRGLALYRSELDPGQVTHHSASWTGSEGRPELRASDGATALYLFDERSGAVVHNKIQSESDLYIPAMYRLLSQRMLEPVWKEANSSPGYRKDVVINVMGFIPYGLFLCAYFSGVRNLPYASLAAILLGFCVSLTIEVVQTWLPTRDSSSSDVLANGLGTAIGVALYRYGGGRVMGLE
jgi:VanZ family protein